MTRLSTRLLAWYEKNNRPLPWRGISDPYGIWVSEIMLQQTRVETVIPYYGRWMKLFPTIEALAAASEREVLSAWEGLGYYGRARNFHKAAKIVAEKFAGQLPRDLDELRKLPGIGRYTVGALASIVFGMDEPALDGNLKRVYSRLFDMTRPVDSAEGEAHLWKLAKDNLPKGKAADFNQALMDLGAMICLPKNPRCLICPVMKFCMARENGTQGVRPVKKSKKALPRYVHAAAVVIQRGRVLLVQRPSKGLLGGLWEFPNGRVDRDPVRGMGKAIKSTYGLSVRVKRGAEAVIVLEHTYSHFHVTVHAYLCQLIGGVINGKFRWVLSKDLDTFPMGKIDRRIATVVLAGLY